VCRQFLIHAVYTFVEKHHILEDNVVSNGSGIGRKVAELEQVVGNDVRISIAKSS
jgi:hypothetical protein